jgi:hypothetical protein
MTTFLDISTQTCIGFKFHVAVDTVSLSTDSEYSFALKLCLRRGDKLQIVWDFRGDGWPTVFYLLLPEYKAVYLFACINNLGEIRFGCVYYQVCFKPTLYAREVIFRSCLHRIVSKGRTSLKTNKA